MAAQRLELVRHFLPASVAPDQVCGQRRESMEDAATGSSQSVVINHAFYSNFALFVLTKEAFCVEKQNHGEHAVFIPPFLIARLFCLC